MSWAPQAIQPSTVSRSAAVGCAALDGGAKITHGRLADGELLLTADEFQLNKEQTVIAAVGNGRNDRLMLQAAALGIAVALYLAGRAWIKRRWGERGASLGGLLPWALVALAAAVFLPAAICEKTSNFNDVDSTRSGAKEKCACCRRSRAVIGLPPRFCSLTKFLLVLFPLRYAFLYAL